MRYLCGQGRVGSGDLGSTDVGVIGRGGASCVSGLRGEGCGWVPIGGMGIMVVGAVLMWWVIRSGTESGVTFSMMVKEGRRRTVVGAEAGGGSSSVPGTGMLEAESIIF